MKLKFTLGKKKIISTFLW